jgi:hypothetical protein
VALVWGLSQLAESSYGIYASNARLNAILSTKLRNVSWNARNAKLAFQSNDDASIPWRIPRLLRLRLVPNGRIWIWDRIPAITIHVKQLALKQHAIQEAQQCRWI